MTGSVDALLLGSLLLPVAGLLALPWAGRAGAIAGCIGGAALLLVGISVVVSSGSGWPDWGSVPWIVVPSNTALTVRAGIRFDAFAVGGALSFLLAGGLILATTTNANRLSTAMVVATVLASIGCLVSADVVQWIVLAALSSVAACLATGADSDVPGHGIGTRRILMTHLLADLLLVVSALMLLYRLGTAAFSGMELEKPGTVLRFFLETAPTEKEFSSRVGITSLVAFTALGAAVGRSGSFPLFGWLHDAGRRPLETSALLLAVVAPCGVMLLVRIAGPFAVAEDVRLVLVMCGALTAVVSGVITLAQDEPRVVVAYAVSSTLGVALAGLGAGGMGAEAAVKLLLALPVVTAAICWGLAHGSTAPGSRIVMLAGGVLASGLLGQGVVIEDRLSTDPAGGMLATAMLATGMACAAFGLTRMSLRIAHDPATSSGAVPTLALERQVPVSAPVIEGVVSIGLIAWLVLAWTSVRLDSVLGLLAAETPTYPGPLTFGTGLLVAGAGAVAAYVLRGRGGDDPGRVGEPLGPLVRLSRHRFYMDEFVQLFFSLPTRAVAQMGRFVDWFVIDGVLTGGPRVVLGLIDGTSRPLRRGSVPIAVLSLILVAAVLAWALVW